MRKGAGMQAGLSVVQRIQSGAGAGAKSLPFLEEGPADLWECGRFQPASGHLLVAN